MFNIHYLYL